MKIIAHRCGTDIYEEQTIAAARHSLSLGADMVEVDIRFTSDNVPVVIHDPTTDHLYGTSAKVEEITAAEFLALRRTADSSVCGHTFAHYLQCGIRPMLFHNKVGGQRLNIVLDMCRDAGILDQVTFGVVDPEDARIVKKYGDIAVLAFIKSQDQINEFAAAGVDYIRLWQEWCTEENIAAVKATGKKLWIMSRYMGQVGEVSGEPCYRFYESTGADGVLVNVIEPAIRYFKK